MWQSITVFPKLAAAYAFARSLPHWQGVIDGIAYAVERGGDGNLYAWQWRSAANRFEPPAPVAAAAAQPDTFERRPSFLDDSKHWLMT